MIFLQKISGAYLRPFRGFQPHKTFLPLNAWICAPRGHKIIAQGIEQDGHWILQTP